MKTYLCKKCGKLFIDKKMAHNHKNICKKEYDNIPKSVNNLDQFYTKSVVAQKCYNKLKTIIDISDFDVMVEPSAGKGSFYNLFPKSKRLGFDLEPKATGIRKLNYFNFVPSQTKKYIVIGNPPFGRISSIAVKFFNKSAHYANCIAFIIPRTFKRVSIQNKLDLNFHLIYNEDLPLTPCAFEPSMNAKCCFQIWQKKPNKRNKIVYPSAHSDFYFLKLGPKDKNNQPTVPKGADFALKAYGSNCGGIETDNLDKLRPKSWHWIKSNINIKELIKRFNSLDYSISKDTVRQDSIGQKELIYIYKQKY